MKWKNIPGFKSYQVSDSGLIKSINRYTTRNGHPKKVNERILKVGITPTGYFHVTLRSNNNPHTKRVHCLVAQSFLGKKPNGLVVHHKDGNKQNNNVNNLEYVSRQKNTQEYYKMNGKSTGSVPIKDIPIIIDRVNKGHKCIDIASEYNVTRNDIAVLCKIIALTGEEL